MPFLDDGLLRSVVVFPHDPAADVLLNLQALTAEVIPPDIDAHILHFLRTIADKAGRAADIDLVRRHYTNLQNSGDGNGLPGHIRLDAIQTLPFLPPPDFRYALDRFRDRVLGDGLGYILQQASTMLAVGLSQPATRPGAPPTFLKGPEATATYLEQQLALLTGHFKVGDLEGSLRDLSSVMARYQQVKAGSLPILKLGIGEIDLHHDIWPGDLVLVLGYTGQMKSTFMMNIAYNLVIKQKKNVALLPLEMSAHALERMLAVIHTTHWKFHSHWKIDPATGGYADHTITYDKVVKGKLNPDEEAWLQAAIDDLQTSKDYGTIVYREPDTAITVTDVRRWAEAQDRTKAPLDALLIDYIPLVNPSSGGSAMKESALANIAVREFKQTAQFFAGRGIPIISPWNSNREGFKEAEKNGGRYSLRALAWAPEAEKSADLVYTLYRDDQMTQNDELQIGNIKARDRALIVTPFRIYASGSLRVIEDYDANKPYQQKMSV